MTRWCSGHYFCPLLQRSEFESRWLLFLLIIIVTSKFDDSSSNHIYVKISSVSQATIKVSFAFEVCSQSLAGRRGQVVENSTRKDVSIESRDRISATAKGLWCSLTDGHLLVSSSCLRPVRDKKVCAQSLC